MKLYRIMLYTIITLLALTSGLGLSYVSYISQPLHLLGFGEWVTVSCYMLFGNLFNYLFFSTLAEFANPSESSERRSSLIRKEVWTGTKITTIISTSVSIYMRYFVQYTPFYGSVYFNNMSLYDVVIQGFIFLLLADTWFYWTHRVLHKRGLFKDIHFFHHRFVETTAFSQISVHPIEGVIHGPLVFIVPQLLYPIHPMIASTLGYLTGVYAILAHDGNELDMNHHVAHHLYKKREQSEKEVDGCNYGLYWGLWDYICGTRYSKDTCISWRGE